jgi:hypothetical protein
MAKKDTMTVNGKGGFPCLNIDQPVGRCQPNAKNDVKLIQAMFRKLAEWTTGPNGGPLFLGLHTWNEVPDPKADDGNFEDGRTEKAIWSYQRKYARRLLRVDGIIHPAAYQDTNIKGRFSEIRLMTITLLHDHLLDAALMRPGANETYIEAIKRTAPDLPL